MNKILVFNWSEFLLTSFFLMLIAGAVGASLDIGTLSFLQTLGIVYGLKALVGTLTVTFVNNVESVLKMKGIKSEV